MQTITDFRWPPATPAEDEKLLWEDGRASPGMASRQVPFSFHWRAGSNAACGEGESALRWRNGDGARYAVLASPFGSVVWMSTVLPAESDKVNISFDARDLTGRECCVPIVYAGRLEPRFPAFFKSDFETIAGSWRGYHFTVEVPRPIVPPLASKTDLVVAIGFADPGSVRAEVPAGQEIGLTNIIVSRA